MRRLVTVSLCFIFPLLTLAKGVKDTVRTSQDDKIILTYNLSRTGEHLVIDVPVPPRIIPSRSLVKACGGEIDRLKVVAFDRIGDYGKVKWKGLFPTAFMVPSGLSYDRTLDGFYIFGESQPIVFNGKAADRIEIKIPLYIAVYEKKQSYKIVSDSREPWVIEVNASTSSSRDAQSDLEKKRTIVYTSEVLEADNEEIMIVLSGIALISELLERETEFPFSTTLQAEISRLSSMKSNIKESDILEKINHTLLQCDAKEKELKSKQREAEIAAKAADQALIEQQKMEAAAKLKETEEKARIQEEKKQKRTLWMVIGSAIMAVLGFIGNTIFKNIQDKRNQKSLMQMQQSLVRQAEYEATRRSRELVRNGMHQAANKGRNKLRAQIQNSGGKSQNNKRRTI